MSKITINEGEGNEVGASKTIRPLVKRHLEERAGSTCYVSDMVDTLGLTRKQIQAAAYALVNIDHDPIQIVISGNAWQWDLIERNGKMVAARPGSGPHTDTQGRQPIEEEEEAKPRQPREPDPHAEAHAQLIHVMSTPPAPAARYVSYRVLAERADGEILGQAASDDDDGFYTIKPV